MVPLSHLDLTRVLIQSALATFGALDENMAADWQELPKALLTQTHTIVLDQAAAIKTRMVWVNQPAGNGGSVDDLAALTKARSLLLLLLATCKETQLALEAAANALDTDLTADLKAMIERSEAELVTLNAKIKAVSAP